MAEARSLHHPDSPLRRETLGGNFTEKLLRGAWFQFSLFISFLPIKHQNVLLSVRIEVWTPPAAGEERRRGREGGDEESRGGQGGRERRGEDRGSLVEFTHHITAANRNPQSISDIFIIPVKFS